MPVLFDMHSQKNIRACYGSSANNCVGGNAAEASMALAKLCLDTILEEGVKAKIALEAGDCTPIVEKIIEANPLLSGIGSERAGLAGAHAIPVTPETVYAAIMAADATGRYFLG